MPHELKLGAVTWTRTALVCRHPAGGSGTRGEATHHHRQEAQVYGITLPSLSAATTATSVIHKFDN